MHESGLKLFPVDFDFHWRFHHPITIFQDKSCEKIDLGFALDLGNLRDFSDLRNEWFSKGYFINHTGSGSAVWAICSKHYCCINSSQYIAKRKNVLSSIFEIQKHKTRQMLSKVESLWWAVSLRLLKIEHFSFFNW